MAQKRMFSKVVTNSDAFLDLPDSSQVLYFHLSMNADDDGFINNWKSIIRMTGTKEDDLKLLIAKSFIIPFESGVIVIRHWRLNNYLQSDRIKKTEYQDEFNQLNIGDNGVYNLYTDCIHSIEENRIDKNSIEYKESISKDIPKKVFTKPTVEEIKNYCNERKNSVDAETFYNFYESKDWYVGKNKMKDWKACVRTWEKNRETKLKKKNEFLETMEDFYNGTITIN